jgi:hypothetical protein
MTKRRIGCSGAKRQIVDLGLQVPRPTAYLSDDIGQAGGESRRRYFPTSFTTVMELPENG